MEYNEIRKLLEPTIQGCQSASKIDGVRVKVYSPEKTLADCFKFRNKIGMDVVLEAFKLYKSRKKFNLSKLLNQAKICRVEKVMRPYLEAIL
jgi:hypothetical protein